MTIILNNRNPVPCEVTYNEVDLIVGLVVSKYDEDLLSWIANDPIPANQASNRTYVGFFEPSNRNNFLVELMVFTDISMTTVDTNYGISSRSFKVDSFIEDYFMQIQNQISGLASLIGASPKTNITGKINNNASIKGIVEETEL